jgi:hypothetical protein
MHFIQSTAADLLGNSNSFGFDFDKSFWTFAKKEGAKHIYIPWSLFSDSSEKQK